MSDLLVRLEYEPDQRSERTISLGGSSIARQTDREPHVFLVPSLRFVATLNNDHTVKPLSPRVLDRSALIEVVSSGRMALKRAGIQLDEDIEDSIDQLNNLLESRGAAFSVRSASSLKRAIMVGNESGLTTGQVLDMVLVQEVLSRVRLSVGDPRDELLLNNLKDWAQQPYCSALLICSEKIESWDESIRAGCDVFQA